MKCLIGVLLFIFAWLPCRCSGATSFLDWIDDTNTDNSLIGGRSVVVSLVGSKEAKCSFTSKPGEAFVEGWEETNGKTSRVLKCVHGLLKEVHTVNWTSIPDNATMAGLVESVNGDHHLLHFLESDQSAMAPKSHTAIELDKEDRIVGIKQREPTGNDWAAYGIDTNIIQHATPTTALAYPLREPWGAGATNVLLFATFDYHPKVYAFEGDKYLGSRGLLLMPLESIYFVRSGQQVLMKVWFGLKEREPTILPLKDRLEQRPGPWGSMALITPSSFLAVGSLWPGHVVIRRYTVFSSLVKYSTKPQKGTLQMDVQYGDHSTRHAGKAAERSHSHDNAQACMRA